MAKYIEDEDYYTDRDFEDELSDLEYDEIIGNESIDREGEDNQIEDESQEFPLLIEEEDEQENKDKKRKSLAKRKRKVKPKDKETNRKGQESYMADSDYTKGGIGYFLSDNYEAFGLQGEKPIRIKTAEPWEGSEILHIYKDVPLRHSGIPDISKENAESINDNLSSSFEGGKIERGNHGRFEDVISAGSIQKVDEQKNSSAASVHTVTAVEPKRGVSDIHCDIENVAGIERIEEALYIEETDLIRDEREHSEGGNRTKSSADTKPMPACNKKFLSYPTEKIAMDSLLRNSETVDQAGNIIKGGIPLPHMAEIIDSKADRTVNNNLGTYIYGAENRIKPEFVYSTYSNNAAPQAEKVTVSVGEGVQKANKSAKKIFEKESLPMVNPSDYYSLLKEKARKSGNGPSNESSLTKTESLREIRAYDERPIRKYNSKVRWKISVQTVGEVTKSTVLDELQDYDDNVRAGTDAINKDIGSKLDYIGGLGARDLYAIYAKRKNEAAEAAISFKKVMGTHKIPIESLNDKKHLKKALESIGKDEIDKRSQWIIIKHRKDIRSNLRIQGELLESADKGILNLSSDQRDLLESGRLFDTKHTGVYESVLKRSLTSNSDEYVRTIGRDIGRLKAKEIDKLIKKAKENNAGSKVIRIIEEYRKIAKEKELRAGCRNSLSVVKIISDKIKYMNTGEGEGLRQIIRLKNIAGSIAGLTKTSAVTGIKAVSASNHFIVSSIKPLREADVRLKSAKAGIKDRVRKKKRAAVGAAREAIGNTRAVKNLNVVKDSLKSSVKSGFNRVSKTKAGKTAKGIIKKGRNTVRSTGYVGGKILGFISAPFRTIAKGINLIHSGIKKIIAVVIIALGIVVVIYMGMLYIFSAIAMLSDGVQDAVNALGSYINTNDMRPYLQHLNVLDTIQYDEAKAIGEGTPKNPEVYHGHTIDHYGHPENSDGENVQDASNGWKIHYQDAYGNPIANYSTNAKDLMCMAATMFGNYFEPDAALNASFYELLDDLYELMNPDITWVESDIYTLAYMGEDTYSYKCNSDSNYSEMEDMRNEGVRFYESVEEKSGGCYCPGHTTRHSDGSSSTEYCDGCKCDGHSVTVCYGHKDIDIYITIYDKDYAYAENIYPEDWEGKSYAPYIKEFMDTGAWVVQGNCDYCDLLYGTDWYEYYGVDVEGGYGFTVGEPLSDADIEEILASYNGDLDETRKAICEFALSMVGRISYYWGGHASVQGFEGNDFGMTVTPDSKGRNKKGLDCSGFVSWVYWTVTGYKPPAYTGAITQNFNQISYSELKPGSIALLIPPGTENTKKGSYNHVGIYVGQDSNGNDMWVHCSGSSGVVCNNKTNWRLYYDLFD